MEFERTPLHDLIVIKPKIHGDPRGYFVETWQQREYSIFGIYLPFVQDNHSSSKKNILRGLHFQKQHPQGKLVYVTLGEIFDVAVDIRPKSSTFGGWHGVILSEKNQHQFWVPPGFAHGFCVLSEKAHVQYKCTEYYHPEDEDVIRWDDPDIGIEWPIQLPELSQKDQAAQSWKAYLQKSEELSS